MLLKGKNNAVGQLYAGIGGLATTCQITAGHTFTGIETPFNMTIYDLSETNDVINYEIATVTNIAINVGYDTFSITRAQEGTSAQGHLIGKNCANLITYGIVDGINDAIGTQTYTEQNFVTNGESATDSLDAIDVGLSSHLAEIAPSPEVFGVYWDKGATPTLTRLNAGRGAVVNLGVDSTKVLNEFDSSSLFLDWEEVTDTLGNVFIRIPKTYLKKEDTTDYKTWFASRRRFDGCYLPWCFWDFDNGVELDYIDVGKHLASLGAGNKLESKPNVYPAVNINIVNFRTYAQNNNVGGLNGYQQLDIHVIDLLHTLFYIEQATLNSQSKVAGYTSGQYVTTHTALATESGANRILLTNAQGALYEVGQSISVGTSLGGNQIFYGRTITSKDVDAPSAGQTAINFDGAPVNITTGNIVYNTGYKTGFSTNIASSVGSINSNSSGKHPFVWHGIESLFGDVFQFVDGANINEYQTWVCKDAKSYASNVFTSPYEQLGYVNANADGYIKALGFDENYPFANFPTETGGSTTTYYSDYYYRNTGQRIAHVGGYWISRSNAGLSYWVLVDTSSTAGVIIGARLLKKPL